MNDQAGKTYVNTKTVHKTTKINAGMISNVELEIPKGLGKDTFVICVISSEGIQEQYTIHKPIGVPDCGEDEWVATRTSEINTLLQRAKDPNAPAVNKAIALKRNEIIESTGLMIKKGEDLYYPDIPKKSKGEIYDEANEDLKEDKRADYEAHEAKQAGKPKAAKYRGFKATVRDYLPLEVIDAEKKIEDALKANADFQAFVTKVKSENTYKTRGGPLEDQPQVGFPFIPKGSEKERAIDAVRKTLAKMSRPDPDKKKPGPKAPPAPPPSKEKKKGGGDEEKKTPSPDV